MNISEKCFKLEMYENMSWEMLMTDCGTAHPIGLTRSRD